MGLNRRIIYKTHYLSNHTNRDINLNVSIFRFYSSLSLITQHSTFNKYPKQLSKEPPASTTTSTRSKKPNLNVASLMFSSVVQSSLITTSNVFVLNSREKLRAYDRWSRTAAVEFSKLFLLLLSNYYYTLAHLFLCIQTYFSSNSRCSTLSHLVSQL